MLPHFAKRRFLAAFSVLFACPAAAEQVVISEIHYHPEVGQPEYFEITNLTATVFDIAGWQVSDGVDFQFPDFDPGDAEGTFLKAFERILVSSVDEATLRAAYPTIPAATKIFGPWVGALSNGGERLAIENKNGVGMSEVEFGDGGRKWPVAADGAGHSLQLVRPNRGVSDWRNWAASAVPGGTPGEANVVAPDLGLRLSEVHYAADGSVDWVELFANTTAAVPLDGLFLASAIDFSDKVALSGTLAGGGYTSIDLSFPPDLDGRVTVYLIDSSDAVLAAKRFNQRAGFDSFQSLPPGGEWFGGAGDTRDSPNSPARNTDIVINEVMYDPPSDARTGEYVELYNRGASAVDIGGWRFVDGIGFTFPAGTSIASGGYLVVAADAAWMSEQYGAIPVIGNFSGQLRDSGELLRLEDAVGNFADEVFYMPGGDWPELADGDGSSMELRHPDMDNSVSTAWADSDESGKSSMRRYSVSGQYLQNNSRGGTDDYRELHLHLVGDAYVILENVMVRKDGTGPNFVTNGTSHATNGSSASGWLCQGTHWASFVQDGQLHLICDGHGDNKANRAEIDITGIADNDNLTIEFDAKWVYGKPRLIAQTWDHSVGKPFLIDVPNDLGTPGAANSALLASPAPAVSGLVHSPAVPSSSNTVLVTARISPGDGGAPASVELVHRLDNNNANGTWLRTAMSDDGATGGDAVAGDGVYSATLGQYQNDNAIVQFYVEAAGGGGTMSTQPKLGAGRPAMYVVDNSNIQSDLRTQRFVISQYDRDAIDTTGGNNGHSAKYEFDFPRMSNHYFNCTFISNEQEIFYNAEIRKSGSPFTRSNGNGLDHGKWKLPGDRYFRNQRKRVIDPSTNYNDRIARYFLYLLGHPINENEWVRTIINGGSASLREDMEPIASDFIGRNFENGRDGTLLRIDDEWFFEDVSTSSGNDGRAPRGSRNATWEYKDSDAAIRYQSEWLMRSRESDYDYTPFVEFVRTLNSGDPEPQLEAKLDRMMDHDLCGLNAAVRGYDSEWDTFTIDRGKNGYFYRKPDGLWMLVHWDGDRSFEGGRINQNFTSTRTGTRTYLDKPYFRRYMYYYLTELMDKYTEGSARTATWMQLEENTASAPSVNITKYNNWFRDRKSRAESFIGGALNAGFQITTDNSPTALPSIQLNGTAPSSVYDVRVVGQPGASSSWSGTDTTEWQLDGVVLQAGQNTITVEGVNHEGVVVHSETFVVTKNGNSPPVMAMVASPASFNIAQSEVLSLDSSGSYDPEGGALGLTWGLASSDGATLVPSGGTATVTFSKPGLYRVTATGDDGTSQSEITREVAVFGGEGFSSFGDDALEPFWEFSNVEIRDNSPDRPWYSVVDRPGRLRLHLPPESAYPLGLPEDPLPVPQNYISLGDSWRYNDSNVDLGDAFTLPGYDDSVPGWDSGPGIFGYDSGTFPAPGRQTPLTRGNVITGLVTYYFRKEFEFTDDPIGSQISISAMLDDGMRVWLNGSEVAAARVRMPAAPVAEGWWRTPASGNTPAGDERTLLPVATFDGSGFLVNGTNVIAIDLHNSAPGSSDAVFDMTMDIAARPLPDGPPGIDDTIFPWVKRDLPSTGDWILQTDLELPGLQVGEFIAGLMVEIVSGNDRNRYGFGYSGDELAVVQVTQAATTGSLFDQEYVEDDDVAVRIRREGDQLVFEWRPDESFVEVYRLNLPAGSTATTGGPFASTEVPETLDVEFDYVMLIDPGSTSPAAGDLVITEVMYKPDGGEALEFLELYNAGSSPIDLAGYRFPQGSPFDEFVFGDITIEPGAYLLVVHNLAAFQAAYGNSVDHLIAGEWINGNLRNSGEVITLLDDLDRTVASFEYGDLPPWPTSPDTDGVSLTLIDPATGSSSDGANWTGSRLVGGTPGGAEITGLFADWMEARGEFNPLATKQGEAVGNLITYAVGLDLAGGDLLQALPATGVVNIGGTDYLTFEYRRRIGDPGIDYGVQISRDADNWQDASAEIVEIGVIAEGDGTERVTVRLNSAFDADTSCLLRLAVTAS